MDALNIRDELDSYERLSGNSKAIVGRRLLKAATEMTGQIEKLATWLAEGDRVLDASYDAKREETWLKRLGKYERLCDMRDAIERQVLRAG